MLDNLYINSSIRSSNTDLPSFRVHVTIKNKYFKDFFRIFVACMPGFIGMNCSVSCPYPYYGVECQRRCNCSRVLCDVSIGCQTKSIATCALYFLLQNKHVSFY